MHNVRTRHSRPANPKRSVPAMRYLYALVASTILLALTACSTTRYVSDGEYLLRRVRIEIDSITPETPLPSDLLSYVSQRPNERLFGLFDWRIGLYNLSQRHSQGWLSRQLRQWGEPPVIFNSEEAQASLSHLTTALYNRGYLHASASLVVDTISARKVRATYHLSPGERYTIGTHREFVADPVIASLLHPEDTIAQRRDFSDERYTPLIGVGAPLSPDLMQAERRRITQILRNRGHWAFREDQIRFEADTLTGYDDAWVHTIIDTTSSVYHIGRVQMTHALPEQMPTLRTDTTFASGVAVILGDHHRIRPCVLEARNHIHPGSLYSQSATSRTYAALSDLGAVRSIAIQYSVDSLAPRPTLNVDILTIPERSKEISGDLIGTHSGGNLGANASLAFTHNNIFRGAEQLRLQGRVGYEELSGLASDHVSYGGEVTLTFPRLIAPFFPAQRQRNLRGRTALSLSYDYLTRPEFRRNLLSGSWGYSWSHHLRPAFRYTFKLLEVDYMHFGYLDEDFLATVPAYTRMLNYRDQFIVSASLTMNYNSSADYRLSTSRWLHNVRLHLQSAGNTLYGLSSLAGTQRDQYGAFSLMNINFAQFVRGELDYSGLYSLGGKNALAYHAAISAVLPYGNSRVLPIDLRYFAGGSSSVRGWSVRGLGPGSMSPSVGTSIFHQVGDIKLDLSAELRLRVSRSWELATFLDAGNIWTAHRDDAQPGGEFSLERLPREIALSTGLGLRWDFDFFLLRLDAGLKLYDPQAPAGERWAIGRRGIGNLTALHFALGYPF